MKCSISIPETLLQGTFRLPLKKKKYPDPTTTLTITALEKLNIFEKYKGCMLLTEGIADNQ